MMGSPRSDQEVREAVAEYVGGLTMADVAKLHGVNETTVSTWMRAAGVTRPKGSTPARRDAQAKRTSALLDLATSGDSVGVVAKRCGIPYRTLAQWEQTERELAYQGEWVQVGGVMRPVPKDAA